MGMEFSNKLENMKEEVFNRTDTDNNGVISLPEFLIAAEESAKRAKEKADKLEEFHEIHEATEFTEDEYKQYKEHKILAIRKMIAEGIIPENYTYSDVPLLSGTFINGTHVMRDGVMLEIHL